MPTCEKENTENQDELDELWLPLFIIKLIQKYI